MTWVNKRFEFVFSFLEIPHDNIFVVQTVSLHYAFSVRKIEVCVKRATSGEFVFCSPVIAVDKLAAL